MGTKLGGRTAALLMCLILVLPVVSACGPGSTTPATDTGSVWGFPFKTGATVLLGAKGLHDENICYDANRGNPYTFNNYAPQASALCGPATISDSTAAARASLDFVPEPENTPQPVYALAVGKVLVADEACHFVVVDHSEVANQIWVAYLHIDVAVTVGEHVTRDIRLGTTAAPASSSCEHNQDTRHVHIAFMTGTRNIGSYASMVGRVLCGFQVIQNAQYPIGALKEVAHPDHIVAPGASLTVRDCPSPSQSVLGASTSNISAATPAGSIGTVTEFALPTTQSQPIAIVAGPDGNLWFTQTGGGASGIVGGCSCSEPSGSVGQMTPSGTVRVFIDPKATAGGGDCTPYPKGITVGPDGNLWYTQGCEFVEVGIGQITLSGAISEWGPPLENDRAQIWRPLSIAAGPDGTLWFTHDFGGINRMTVGGDFKLFLLSSNIGLEGGIAAGPDGNMWFSYDSGIGRITPNGDITQFPVDQSLAVAAGITRGPDGNLWFAEQNGIGRISPAGNITSFPLSQPNSHPDSITAGPDGNLWFTEAHGIGRITPSGVVTVFSVSAAFTTVDQQGELGGPHQGITQGPNGNLWFVDPASDKIGEIAL